MNIDYEKYTDDEIIDFVKNNDVFAQDFLINKYAKLVKLKSRTHFMIGADNEDIIQEGMIGLFKAIRDFDNGKGSFYSFANLCIDRQIFTAIKLANRKKHLPLNTYFSLNTSTFDEHTTYEYIDFIFEKSSVNPEDVLIDKEYILSIKNFINQNLSPFEKLVLRLYLMGESYGNIAKELGKDYKAVDNAIQRIRKKLMKNLS